MCSTNCYTDGFDFYDGDTVLDDDEDYREDDILDVIMEIGDWEYESSED